VVNEERLLIIVSDILELEPNTLNLEDDIVSLGWDSLSVLSLMSKIDGDQDMKLDAELIGAARSVKDLVSILIS
jgi:acyl carrier protein